MKKIIFDVDVPALGNDLKAQQQAQKDQQQARSTVLDRTEDVPQFSEISIDLTDPNSSLAMKVNAKTYPGKEYDKEPTKVVQGFRKSPDKFVHGGGE